MGMSAILGMWPKHFVYILATLSKGVFIWNLSLIGLMVSEKTVFFKYIYGDPIWVTSSERSKVNLDLWDLFIAIVPLG